jgi:hypothetical protein
MRYLLLLPAIVWTGREEDVNGRMQAQGWNDLRAKVHPNSRQPDKIETGPTGSHV